MLGNLPLKLNFKVLRTHFYLRFCWNPPVYIRIKVSFQVFGTEGMLTLDTMKETSVKTFNARGSIDPPIAASFPERFERAYQIELDHFIDVVKGKRAYQIHITKTRLFKYKENFTSKNWKFWDKNLWYFSYFFLHEAVLTSTHNLCFSRNKKNNVYSLKPLFY